MSSTVEESIQIAVGDGEAIAGTLVSPGTLIPGVLFVHGWGGSQAQYLARAREVAALGCVCLAFDLRGHALTKRQFETVSREQNLADLVAAYDTLAREPHVDRDAIAVVGSSYGGYLAAILTTMRPVKWLALRAPALYMESGWQSPKLQLHRDQDLRSYRGSLVPASDNRALKACQAFGGDMLIVQSENDAIIPKATIASYREAATKARSLTWRCLAGADHGLTNPADQHAYSTVLVGWLKEMIGGARRGPVEPPPREFATPPESPPEQTVAH
jgi:dienelactone hydrolase